MNQWVQNVRKGQSTVEYAVLIAVVVAAILGMQLYVRRAMMGRTKDLADQQLSVNQFDPKTGNYEVNFVTRSTRDEQQIADGTSNSTIVGTEENRTTPTAAFTVDAPKITDKLID